jgi:hypothetical protein
MHGVEHNHAFSAFGRIIAKYASLRVTAPDFENGCFHSFKR